MTPKDTALAHMVLVNRHRFIGLITKAELLAEVRAMKERRLREGRPGSA